MIKKVFIYILFVFVFALSPSISVNAQCSMCTINAEQGTQNGNTQGKGLNDGVLYLLALPYLMIAGIGYIWYRNYKKKLDTNKSAIFN